MLGREGAEWEGGACTRHAGSSGVSSAAAGEAEQATR